MKTTKDRAEKVLRIVEEGPAFLASAKFLHDQYLLWARTWIIPELKLIVSELEETTQTDQNQHEKKTT